MNIQQSKQELFKDNIEINEALHNCMAVNTELKINNDSMLKDIKDINEQILQFNKSLEYIDKQVRVAAAKQMMWYKNSMDYNKLVDLNRTKEQAENLQSYFEGVVEGLMQVRNYIKR